MNIETKAEATATPTVGNVAGADWRVIDDVRPLATVIDRPAYAADASLVDEFQRDGVVIVPGAFADWVEPLRAGLQRNLDRPDEYAFPCDSTTAGEPGRFFDSYCNWQRIGEYLTFVLSSPAAAMAAQFMQSDTAQLFHDHAFSKEAGTQKATPWHHDLPYYCVDGSQTVSIYVALDAAGEDTVIRFSKRSHRSGHLYYPRAFSSGADYVSADESLRSAPTDAELQADHDILATPLQPGDAVLFDFRTLHGTTDAPITTRRRAFSTRWLGDDAVYCERPGETSPPLVNLNVEVGERLRPDWFPVLWPPPTK